jgi:hypothetical protein
MRISHALHGLRFAIEAHDALAGAVAEAVMPGCVRARARGRPVTVFRVQDEGERWQLSRGGRRLWDAMSEAELIPWLEAEVVYWLLGRLRRYVQFHTAVIERNGSAVLIVGGPGSGKTSLACAAGQAGWGVMSDEVALVEPTARTVYSFPRALLVRPGTVRRLRGLGRFPARRVLLDEGPTRVRYVNPALLGGRARDRARIDALVFPSWGSRSAARPVGEREALERLLEACFSEEGDTKRSLDTCLRLVGSARRAAVRVGRLKRAVGVIAEAAGVGR